MDLLDAIDIEYTELDELTASLIKALQALPSDHVRVRALNRIRMSLHAISPLRNEPVDCIQWVEAERVQANDYNPNTVAPPEMELLKHSIEADGYTQPIVTWAAEGGMLEVVDGFHRHRVGRECPEIRARILHFLPVVVANEARTDRGDRIASTIRHNRARGKHRIDGMSAIVVELKRRNWSDAKIGRELGMDPDEVLRLAQISGLAEMFADREFSQAWEIAAIDDTDTLNIQDECPIPETAKAGETDQIEDVSK